MRSQICSGKRRLTRRQRINGRRRGVLGRREPIAAPSSSTPYRPPGPNRGQASRSRQSRTAVSAPCCRAVSTGSGSARCRQRGASDQRQLGFRVTEHHRRARTGPSRASRERWDRNCIPRYLLPSRDYVLRERRQLTIAIPRSCWRPPRSEPVQSRLVSVSLCTREELILYRRFASLWSTRETL
jgi:hypothetical protein